MSARIFCLALAVLAGAAFCQNTYYAPDLRWDDAARAYLGFANPAKQAITVKLTGYDATGAVLGERVIDLPRFGRFEAAARDLLETGTPAWVRLEASDTLAGYVRTLAPSGTRWSLTPLNRFAGDEAWIPQLSALEDLGPVEVALINAAEAGQARLFPFRDTRYRGTLQQAAEARLVPEYGASGQKTRLRYEAIYDTFAHALSWDRVTAEGAARLTGALHFGVEPGSGAAPRASLAVRRTPSPILAAVPVHDVRDPETTRFELVNVNPGPLDVTVTFYGGEGEVWDTLLTLPARERITIRFNDLSQFSQPFDPQWYRFTANETGLIGYQLTVSPSGAAAALAGDLDPASQIALPYTPTQPGLETRIVLLNPEDQAARVYAYGFDNEGKLVRRLPAFYQKPRQKTAHSMTELFGDRAPLISWVRLLTTSGQIAAYSMTAAEGGEIMAALPGTAAKARGRTFFRANFEFIEFERLAEQGWTADYFDSSFPHKDFDDQKDHYFDIHNRPIWGQIFTESAFIGEVDNLSLGYEPPEPFTRYLRAPLHETIAYRSPFFETPDYGPLYLSFLMRFINPQHASPGSRYGIAWREEGSERWRWFGLSGELLLDPPFAVRDCWIEGVAYRDLDNLVTLSGWLPFQARLPDEARGKRLQVALFYDHIYYRATGQGPIFFIDDARVVSSPVKNALFYEEASGEFIRSDESPNP